MAAAVAVAAEAAEAEFAMGLPVDAGGPNFALRRRATEKTTISAEVSSRAGTD